jgi:hypothetical protein
MRTAAASTELASPHGEPAREASLRDDIEGRVTLLVDTSDQSARRRLKQWIVGQALGVNLANVALLITMIVISVDVRNTLSRQEAENQRAVNMLTQLQAQADGLQVP